MINLDLGASIDSIPYLLYMEQQEADGMPSISPIEAFSAFGYAVDKEDQEKSVERK